VEDGEVSPGFASVAAPVVDHNDLPVAGLAVTFTGPVDLPAIVAEVRRTAALVSARLRGRG
jgi:DNA-binding IclR family transcriptional regulator